jgi:SecD/SecF fusion protein
MKTDYKPKATGTRLVFCMAVFAWAFRCITPVSDMVPERMVGFWNNNKVAFLPILEKAQKRVTDGDSSNLFNALRAIGIQDQVDYSLYFDQAPPIDEPDLAKRNHLLLTYLIQQSQSKIRQGLDMKGGIALLLTADPHQFASPQERDLAMEQAKQVLYRRADNLGVVEPVIRIIRGHHLEIQLPGISTQDNPDISNILQKPVKLEFCFLNDQLDPDHSPNCPEGYRKLHLTFFDQLAQHKVKKAYFVSQKPALDSTAIQSAKVVYAGSYGPQVSFKVKPTMREAVEALTRGNLGKNLAIVLDGELFVAPVIREIVQDGTFIIEGPMTPNEAKELVSILNNSVNFELKLSEMYEVGPSIAENQKERALLSGICATGGIAALLTSYYLSPGLLAIMSALFAIMIVLATLMSAGGSLSMPGVAGIVLTLGMAVDGNILIYERMREEFKRGGTLGSAVLSGYRKALSTILDANLTTLFAALCLVGFGIGPIRGFGVTLCIGVLASMFATLVYTKAALDLCVIETTVVEQMFPFEWFKDAEYNFFKYRNWALGISLLVLAIGAVSALLRHTPLLGIDFSGGEKITLTFEEKPSIKQILGALPAPDRQHVQATYVKALGQDRETLHLQTPLGRSDQLAQVLRDALPDADFQLAETTQLGSVFGEHLRSSAYWAVGLAMASIMAYVAFRFELGFGIGALVSTLHDAGLTLAVFILMGGQISIPVLAGLLMIIGYSINDTIIVFDRIREELPLNPRLALADIINLAVNKTLGRTVLTSVTTLISAVMLYLFSSNTVKDLSLVVIIGVITGTLSSIYIASPIVHAWHKGDRQRIGALHHSFSFLRPKTQTPPGQQRAPVLT